MKTISAIISILLMISCSGEYREKHYYSLEEADCVSGEKTYVYVEFMSNRPLTRDEIRDMFAAELNEAMEGQYEKRSIEIGKPEPEQKPDVYVEADESFIDKNGKRYTAEEATKIYDAIYGNNEWVGQQVWVCGYDAGYDPLDLDSE